MLYSEIRWSDKSWGELIMNNKMPKQISAILLIILGIIFGSTWGSAGFCLGDNVFTAIGLPVWSNGTSGTHYPAIVGIALILIGVAVLSPTLSKKARFWVWSIVILILLIIGLLWAI